MNQDEERLANLFAAYREALPDPVPGPGFMPGLWAKIEARQRSTKLLRRLTGAFVAAAAALTLVMGIYITHPPESPVDSSTYVDALDEEDIYHTVAHVDRPVMRRGFDVQ
jgi:hypothetical protein